jgi:hypothetical protein
MQDARDVMRQRAASTCHPRGWRRSSGLAPVGAERLLVVEARAHVARENARARLWSRLRRWLTR